MLRLHAIFTKILSVFVVLFLSVSLSFAQKVEAIRVSGGEDHSMVLTENGKVFTCGSSTLGHDEDSDIFNLVLDGEMATYSNLLENISDIAAGWTHSLALDCNGFVWAFGEDYAGQLGNGIDEYASSYPIKVHGGQMGTQFLENIVGIATGRSGTHSLAVDVNGFCWAWGNNNMGQCGSGIAYNPYPEPNKVLGGDMGTQYLEGIIAVSAGEEHSMALTTNNFVYTWGDNEEYHSPYTKGKLGISDTQCQFKTTPQKVKGLGGSGYLSNIVAISAGWDHCMALENYDFFEPANGAGRIYCWGNNGAGYTGAGCGGGRLGDGTDTDRAAPVLVVDGEMNTASGYLEGIVAIGAGESHGLALDIYGNVWAWGANNYGQLGNNSTNQSLTPVKVKGKDGVGYLSNIVAISAGYWHNLAVDRDGILWVWGFGGRAALGLGDYNNRLAPEPMIMNIPDVWNKTQDIHYMQIQPAINAANAGDVIVVNEGTYEENPNFGNKKVYLQSSDPNDPMIVANTVIDGQYSNVLTFTDNLSSGGLTSKVEGITLRGGGYVYCDNSDPIISKCVIKNGSGVYVDEDSTPTIEKCTIQDSYSYGVSSYNSGVFLYDNIVKNSGACGIYGDNAKIYINNCLIENNRNYGIYH